MTPNESQYGAIRQNLPAQSTARGQPQKLGTLTGVTLPTILNVLSILMFVRFGFVIGQMGLTGTLLLLCMSYGIDLLTTLSISAIATNGTVKGGGPYYMISRCLGPEFGGAIGIILFIGQILNASLNVAGVVEPIMYNFGPWGAIGSVLPAGSLWEMLYCTTLLAASTVVALIGAGLVSRCGTFLCAVLLIATLSIPICSALSGPRDIPGFGYYSGPSLETLQGNMWTNYTTGAAGSQTDDIETFNDLFGVFFPATAGILAGSSMSGDLKHPSKAIPTGTLSGMFVTFVCYLLVIGSMCLSIPRKLLYSDVQILQTVSPVPLLIFMGECATSLFSIIVGLVGAAQLLQAIARDNIFPGLSKYFAKDEHLPRCVAMSWLLCQIFLLPDVNQLATLITMAFLTTFMSINLACGLLKIGSAPNFRPSFRYFNVYTALAGTIASMSAMFIVDGVWASIVMIIFLFLIVLIHYISPPKTWGDVSQAIIYHQVRKYLLKLRQDNVKYWRPQILLLVDNPRTTWRLISFCNHLKKGGLYVLGHVLIGEEFQKRAAELNAQRSAWEQVRDLSKIKAFIQISIAPSFVWGARNVYIGSGLGGMKPNITILAFYDLSRFTTEQVRLPSDLTFENSRLQYSRQVNVPMKNLPTDNFPSESRVKLTEWVQAIEDLSLLNSNVAVAKGFPRLDIPSEEAHTLAESDKKLIDLYPIQMTSRVTDPNGDRNVLTTNFDTYTLILQLGAILDRVDCWQKTHRLRVVVFVEKAKDVEPERARVTSLMQILRINAEVVVTALSDGDLDTYNYIAKGDDTVAPHVIKQVEETLVDEDWWESVKSMRAENRSVRRVPDVAAPVTVVNPHAMKKIEQSSRGRYSFSKMNKLGVSLSMVANKIPNSDFKRITKENVEDDWHSRSSDSESMVSRASTPPPISRSSTNNDMSWSQASDTSPRPPSVQQILRRPKYDTTRSLRVRDKSSMMFSAETMPSSQVLEDAQGNEPSIVFVKDHDSSDVGNADSKEAIAKETGGDNASKQSSLATENAGPADSTASGKLPENTTCGGSSCSGGAALPDPTYTLGDKQAVSFNELPNRAQFIILNELMRLNSESSALLFSTLPIPEIGLHKDEQDCIDYVSSLEVWLSGLPPTLLINAQTMTVTTNL